MMPVRIQLSRSKGFRLQEHSHALNGLDCVKVDRSTKWGNPFNFRAPEHCWTALAYGEKGDPAGRHAASVKAFRDWITSAAGMRLEACGLYAERGDESLPVAVGPTVEAGPPPDPAELRGKNLACWCPLTDKDGKPVPCHADVLLEIANRERNRRRPPHPTGAEMSTIQDRLRACPFCGSKAVAEAVKGIFSTNIRCSNGNCPAHPEMLFRRVENAIAAWNTRADDALLDEAERMVEEAAYRCEQARTYIAEPAANTSEKNMTSARWHLDKALAKLRKEQE